MRVQAIDPGQCRVLAVQVLGLTDTADLFSTEGIAASLRRAASFLCPATPRQITDAVLDALRSLSPGNSPARSDLSELLELLVSTGDLVELQTGPEAPGRLLYLGPPSYVEQCPGSYLLTGIRPFGAPLAGPELAGAVRHDGHTRTIELDEHQAARQLAALGLHKVRPDQWTRQPRQLPADDLARQFRQRLDAAGPSGEIEGLTLIDPAAKVTYYRGRWRDPAPDDTGTFVGRRPQAYGADLWCAVKMFQGRPRALVDLPADDNAAPGRDEAWRLQAALDAARGTPQEFRIRDEPGDSTGQTADFFSPLPTWAERYLELTGTAISRAAGALCSYRVPAPAVPRVTGYLTTMLWMRQQTNEGAQ